MDKLDDEADEAIDNATNEFNETVGKIGVSHWHVSVLHNRMRLLASARPLPGEQILDTAFCA